MLEYDRRSFLTSAIAALGVAAAGSKDLLAALAQQAPSGGSRGIDVHHHFGPPAWVAEVKGRPLLQTPNTTWTPAKSIEDLDRGGLAAAIVSITNPGLWFGNKDVTRRLSRACNEYAAKMAQDHPTRFGFFAAMPLPDVDATLKEIEYAYDTLKADGVGFMTSFDDTWLGNPAYRPVMEELNRRNAVVFVHPTAANCCRDLNYAPEAQPASMEYGTDTTRAIMGVTFSGDAARFRNIRFIWSHAGGTVPFLAGRIAGAERRMSPKEREERLPSGFIGELKKFYYDTEGAANRGALTSLLTLVGTDKILFGTDFPPGGTSLETGKALRSLNLFSEADMRLIERDNALKLLPRFKT